MSNVEGGNKSLKITIAVDNQAMEQFKRAIREATSEVSKLVETLNKASGLLGGSGRGLMGGVGTKGGGFGSGGVGQQRTSGIGASLTSPVDSIGAGIRNIAKGSTDALRQMETGLRSSVGKQVQDVRVLERALDGLSEKYKKVKGFSGAGGGSMSPGGGGWGMGGNPLPRGGDGSFVGAGQKVVNRGGIDMVVPGNTPDKSFRDRLAGFFGFGGGGAGGGGAGGGGGGQGNLDKLLGEARKVLPFYMMGKGASMIMGQSIAQHDDFNNQAVPLASTFSKRGMDMMYGRDYKSLYNMMQISQGDQGEGRNNKRAAKTSADTRAEAYHAKRVKHFGWTVGSPEEKSDLAQAHRMFNTQESARSKDSVARAGESDFTGSGGFIRGAKNLLDSAMGLDPNILRNLAGVDTAEKLRKDALITQKGQINAADKMNRGLDLYTNQWEGMIGASRQFGTKDPWTMNANLRARGFDMGALGAGQGAVQGSGGWGMAQKYRDLAMTGQAGHVGNIGEFIGLASQGGGPKGSAGVSAHYLAGTGFDPGAQAAMANTLMGHMSSGGTMGSPDGLMAALSAGGKLGGMGDSGEQMRRQAGMGQGMAGLNRDIFGGGQDNLQKGRNIVNALDATGGNLFGANYLASGKMTMGMLAELRSGKPTPALLRKLKSLGISPEQALAYGKSTTSTMFRNVGMDKGAMGDMARDIIGNHGGDIGEYMKSNKGKKGFDSKQALTTIGSMLQAENPDMSDQEAEGRARDLAGLGDMDKLKKGHFRDGAHGTKMLRSAKNRGKFEKEDAASVGKITDDYIDKTSEFGEKYAEKGKLLGQSADELGESLKKFADQVDVITLRLTKAADRVDF